MEGDLFKIYLESHCYCNLKADIWFWDPVIKIQSCISKEKQLKILMVSGLSLIQGTHMVESKNPLTQ